MIYDNLLSHGAFGMISSGPIHVGLYSKKRSIDSAALSDHDQGSNNAIGRYIQFRADGYDCDGLLNECMLSTN